MVKGKNWRKVKTLNFYEITHIHVCTVFMAHAHMSVFMHA